jgi:hypothetical protein
MDRIGLPAESATAMATTVPRWVGGGSLLLGKEGSSEATTKPWRMPSSVAGRPSRLSSWGLRTTPDGVPNMTTALSSSRTASQ